MKSSGSDGLNQKVDQIEIFWFEKKIAWLVSDRIAQQLVRASLKPGGLVRLNPYIHISILIWFDLTHNNITIYV